MNVLIANSGGPTPVISDTIAGLYVGLRKTRPDDSVYASLGSLGGMIAPEADFNELRLNKSQIEMMRKYPTSPLGWSRLKFDFENHPERFEHLKKHIIDYKIDTIYLIGGDDTQRNVWELYSKLLEEQDISCKVIGIPKTIDKDLPETISEQELIDMNLDPHKYDKRYGKLMKWVDDEDGRHLFVTRTTPGFISAAKLFTEYVANTAPEAYGSRKALPGKGRIYLYEAPGRDAGHLAASPGMIRHLEYGPHGIYLPERYSNVNPKAWFNLDHFNNHAISRFLNPKTGNWGVYVLSEGITDKSGNPIMSTKVKGDEHRGETFGGCVYEVRKGLMRAFKEKFGEELDVRALRIGSEPLRSNANASHLDKEYAYSVGHEAALLDAKHGLDGVMVTEDFDPKAEIARFEAVVVPSEWIVGKALVPRNMILQENFGNFEMGSHGTVPITNLTVSKIYTNHLRDLVNPNISSVAPVGELESMLNLQRN